MRLIGSVFCQTARGLGFGQPVGAAAEKGEHLRLRGLRGIARGDWTEGSLHDECNLAATMQADIDVSQPLRHLSSGIELMCVNKTRQPARSVPVRALDARPLSRNPL